MKLFPLAVFEAYASLRGDAMTSFFQLSHTSVDDTGLDWGSAVSSRRWTGESNFLTFVPRSEYQLDQLYGFRQAPEIMVTRETRSPPLQL